MITAATSAKIAIEIPVTNQKTKWIRPSCLLAGCGNHGIRSATRGAPAPQTAPIATSWTIDPLRPAAETTRRRDALAAGSAALETPATREVQPTSKRVQAPHNTRRNEWDSE